LVKQLGSIIAYVSLVLVTILLGNKHVLHC